MVMAYISEYGLSNQQPAPWWIMKVGLLRRLWSNPVFQRNYQRSTLKKYMEPRLAFFIGFLISLAVNSYIYFEVTDFRRESNFAITSSLFIVIFIPLVFFYMVMFVRMFFFCMIKTPVEIRKYMESDRIYPIMSVPIKDSELFYAICLPNFVRGLGVVLTLLAFTAGLILPAFINELPTGNGLTSQMAFIFIPGLAISAVLALPVSMILTMLLLSLSAGFYSLSMKPFPTIISSLSNFLIASCIAIMVAVFIGNLVGLYDILFSPGNGITPSPQLGYYGGHHGHNPWVVLFLLPMIPVVVYAGIMYFFCYITSMMGRSAFSKVRRSGYYEPEFTSAAGLE